MGTALGHGLGLPFRGGTELYLRLQTQALQACRDYGISLWAPGRSLGSLDQVSTGTTPVTAVGQSVGLMLDCAQGATSLADTSRMGADVLAGAGAMSSSGAMTKESGWSIAGGVATYANPYNSGYSNIYSTVPVVAGRSYQYRCQVLAAPTAGIVKFRLGSSTYSDPITSVGIASAVLVAPSTGTLLVGMQHVSGGAAGTCSITVDDLVVRELPGYHAVQTAAGSRPTVAQSASGMYGLALSGAQWMAGPTLSATSEWAMWAGIAGVSGGATLIGRRSGVTGMLIRRVSGTIQAYGGTGAVTASLPGSPAVSAADPLVAEVSMASGSRAWWLNGASQGSDGLTYAPASAVALGIGADAGSGASVMSGQCAAAAYGPIAAPPAAARSAIGRYLAYLAGVPAHSY